MAASVHRSVASLPPGFAAARLPAHGPPTGVLLCPPDHFDVVDVKNPLMEGAVGTVDRERARRQWDGLATAFGRVGLRVERIEPVAGLEDMVFCANQTFTGTDVGGRPACVLSRMRHEARRPEVPAFARWFEERGYRVLPPPPGELLLEGAGDLLWHPGRRLVWAGHGFRSSPEAHAYVADALDVTVLSLALVDERFYHLDTALCAVDERTALLYEGALDDAGRELVSAVFERVVPVPESEALSALACNAAAFPGGVVVEERASSVRRLLENLGHRVLPVDTGEFLKSGGSVFCMKQLLFDQPAREG